MTPATIVRRLNAYLNRRRQAREYALRMRWFDEQIAVARARHRQTSALVAARQAYVHDCLRRA